MRSTPRRSGAELTGCAEPKDPSRFYLRWAATCICGAFACIWPSRAHAMHLADGMLPVSSCVAWAAFAFAIVALAFRRFDRERLRDPQLAPLMAMLGAAVFAISCMPVPVPWVGTCSHPCGTGLAAIIVGPLATVLLTSVALLLQALFLAHGGLTTLGADIASMGIAGGFAGYCVFHGARRAGIGLFGAAFLAGVLSDWATYATTAAELAFGLHGQSSVGTTFGAVALAFAPTQLPLGLLEGVLTAGALTFLQRRRPALLTRLHVLPTEEVAS
jgi:cobalt/nickel transport system permease protein